MVEGGQHRKKKPYPPPTRFGWEMDYRLWWINNKPTFYLYKYYVVWNKALYLMMIWQMIVAGYEQVMFFIIFSINQYNPTNYMSVMSKNQWNKWPGFAWKIEIT